MLTQFIDDIYKLIQGIPFENLLYIIGGAYLAVFALTAAASFFSPRVKGNAKRSFFSFTNVFTALFFGALTMEFGFEKSLTAGALFWAAGYVLYGLICVIPDKKGAAVTPVAVPVRETAVAGTAPAAVPPARIVQPEATAAPAPVAQEIQPAKKQPAAQPMKNSVRLEHAVAVTDKLLTKNLSKADRQELEKLKNTLAVLQIKGTLTPTEAEILNENFNALLKLMAKYNV